MDGGKREVGVSHAVLAHLLGLAVGAVLILGLTLFACLLLRANFY
ncbi:hypothetical protein [Pseudomonas gingeri]|nr:hypothetical protein [Pseudomonas gingeri]